MRAALVLLLVLLLSGCQAPAMDPAPVPGEVAHGTVWTQTPAGPAQRHVPVGATLTIHNASLVGIRLVVDGTLLVRDTDLHLDRGSLVVRGEADVRRSVLHGSPGALLRVENGTVVLVDTDLREAAGNAVRMLGGRLTAHGGTWSGVGSYGVHAEDAEVRLRDVQAVGTADYGVRSERGDLLVEGGRFEGECGIYARDGTVRVEGVAIASTRHGLTLRDADATVAATRFTSAREAVLLQGGALSVQNASFSGVERGLHVYAGHVVLGGSVLAATDAAVDNRNGTVDARGNDFLGPGIGIRNQAASAVVAPDNWWGGDPPAVDVEGAVERDPWRNSPVQ